MRVGPSGLGISAGKGDLSFPKCPDRLWSPPATYSVGTRFLFWLYGDRGAELTSDLDVAEVKTSGAVPRLLLYAFMARAGTDSPLPPCGTTQYPVFLLGNPLGASLHYHYVVCVRSFWFLRRDVVNMSYCVVLTEFWRPV